MKVYYLVQELLVNYCLLSVTGGSEMCECWRPVYVYGIILSMLWVASVNKRFIDTIYFWYFNIPHCPICSLVTYTIEHIMENGTAFNHTCQHHNKFFENAILDHDFPQELWVVRPGSLRRFKNYYCTITPTWLMLGLDLLSTSTTNIDKNFIIYYITGIFFELKFVSMIVNEWLLFSNKRNWGKLVLFLKLWDSWTHLTFSSTPFTSPIHRSPSYYLLW